MKRYLTHAIVIFVFAIVTSNATASVIQNGDFANGLSQWPTESGFDSPVDGGGFAQFTESNNGQQISQAFVVPQGVLSLSFEYLMRTTGGSVVGAVPDSFQATLFTSAGDTLFPSDPNQPSLFPAFFSVDSFGAAPESFDNNFVTVQTTLSGNRRVTLDLQSIRNTFKNQKLTIDFLLNSNPDGINTTVLLDKVVVRELDISAIPEPTAWGVWCLLGLSAARVRRRTAMR